MDPEESYHEYNEELMYFNLEKKKRTPREEEDWFDAPPSTPGNTNWKYQ